MRISDWSSDVCSSDLLLPQPRGLIILRVDGDQQAVLGEAVLLGDQIPGQLDGDVLEVVAEGKVAQHLEEGVVARGVADVLQVVVLATRAHAFLRGGGTAVGADRKSTRLNSSHSC